MRSARVRKGAQKRSTGFTACGKTLIFVIPRRAARRGISPFLRLNQGEIPHFVRNDKINYFFRSLFSLLVFELCRRLWRIDFPNRIHFSIVSQFEFRLAILSKRPAYQDSFKSSDMNTLFGS